LGEFALAAGEIAVTEGGLSVNDVVASLDGGAAVLVVRDAYRRPWQREWVEGFLAARPQTVLVAIGMPGDAELTTGPSVCTFGAGRVNIRAAAEVLAGRRAAG
jgi:beta-N-acetylhexosaminidase